MSGKSDDLPDIFFELRDSSNTRKAVGRNTSPKAHSGVEIDLLGGPNFLMLSRCDTVDRLERGQ